MGQKYTVSLCSCTFKIDMQSRFRFVNPPANEQRQEKETERESDIEQKKHTFRIIY